MATRRSMWAVFPAPPAPPRPPRPSRRSPPAAPPAGAPPAFSPRRCCPGIRRSSSQCVCASSELEPALASTVRQGGDPAVVLVAAAVEDDRRDALVLRALRDEGADLASERALVALALAPTQLERRGAGQRVAGEVVDDLRGDVPGRAGHDQARASRRTRDALADAEVTTGLAQSTCCGDGHYLPVFPTL